ncbi:hypothetical protein QKU48_gp0581 [Fadolivirus algeromassiliense]|jgi:hypothetical protein|uniref:Uncharacterized protein n=1 Tax=Fadolivirus FV1/VV64 TaxID=3070911 RepID=A0A7D3QVX5_9VIRU|nr:hypothetical protein QKU48_gp0581 [Fadolivirus algeromassiliense]QKF94039.1 hypothetical protein Fadolivirus_1_581 [Fadolivirus FV1/VV64]
MSQKAVTQKAAPTTGNKPQAKRKFTPFLTENFSIKNYSLTPLEHNERSEAHLIAYPRNKESTFVFQTPEFTLSQYGIPPLGKYATTDAQRTTLKLPLDPDQPECVQLENMFKEIDNYMKTNQKKIFAGQDTGLSYVYKSIVREPKKQQQPVSDPKKKGAAPEPSKPQKPKCRFWKAKLDINFDTKDIQTVVFAKNPASPDEKPTRKVVTNASDLEQYMPWGSKVRMIVMMNKMWAEKTEKDEGVPLKFGLSFKVLSIETTPREKSGSYRDAIANYAFIDDDEGSENAGEVEQSNNNLDEGVENADEEGEEEGGEEEGGEEGGEEEEGGDEEEEEPEPEPEPVPVKAKKVTPTPVAAKAPAKTVATRGRK